LNVPPVSESHLSIVVKVRYLDLMVCGLIISFPQWLWTTLRQRSQVSCEIRGSAIPRSRSLPALLPHLSNCIPLSSLFNQPTIHLPEPRELGFNFHAKPPTLPLHSLVPAPAPATGSLRSRGGAREAACMANRNASSPSSSTSTDARSRTVMLLSSETRCNSLSRVLGKRVNGNAIAVWLAEDVGDARGE
jgi:hypothetical protein